MIYTTSLPVSKRIKELIGEQIHTVYSWRCTVSFLLPEEKYVENPYKVVLGDHWNDDLYSNGKTYPAYPAVSLSELPDVLKKVGEKLEWGLHNVCPLCGYEVLQTQIWKIYYLKCCEIHALGQSVDDYLISILLPVEKPRLTIWVENKRGIWKR